MDKKEQILQIALNMFGEKGFEGTSIRDLSAEAGINIAMISYYFGSKDKLFEQVIEYKTAYLKTIFLEISQNDSLSHIEKVDAVISHLVDRIFSFPPFHRLIHRELSLNHRQGSKNGMIDTLLGNSFLIRDILNDGIKKGHFQKIDVELSVATLFGTISQLTISEELCRKMIKRDEDFHPYEDKKFRKRIVEHLSNVMHSILLKKETHSIS